MTAQLDIFAARRLRDDGMAKAEEAEPSAWQRAASAWLDSLIASGREFTADDLTDIAGRPTHPNALGALFRRAVSSDRLVMVGRRQSSRVLARGRWQPVYRAR